MLSMFSPGQLPVPMTHLYGGRLTFLYGECQELFGLDLGGVGRVRERMYGAQLGYLPRTGITINAPIRTVRPRHRLNPITKIKRSAGQPIPVMLAARSMSIPGIIRLIHGFLHLKNPISIRADAPDAIRSFLRIMFLRQKRKTLLRQPA